MSTLKTNNVQVGQSATASNNFTWYQPSSPDGTVRLGQGNSGATTGDKITVSSSTVTITGDLTVSGSISGFFAPGTTTLFLQAAAPTGWTKSTTHNDKALRIVSGSGGGSGGSVAFTTAFANTNSGATTLSTAQIPSHTHTFYWAREDVASGGTVLPCTSGAVMIPGTNPTKYTNTNAVLAEGGGGSHTHSLSLAVQYVDAIICVKN